jgi:thiamine-phosphate pyrophosphorylase
MPRELDFSLYLITDRQVLPPGISLPEAVREALDGGVRCLQLREKDLAPRALLPLALELRVLTREFKARLFINDRVDLAQACDADGVHLTTTSLPTGVVRNILGPDKLIGVSTHSAAEIIRAEEEDADFATFGPVFYTASKAAFGPPVGLDKLREACSRTSLPVFALGGVNLPQVDDVMACGASGVALISAILGYSDVREKTRRFIECLPNFVHP